MNIEFRGEYMWEAPQLSWLTGVVAEIINNFFVLETSIFLRAIRWARLEKSAACAESLHDKGSRF